MRVALDVTSFAFGIHAGISVYLRRLATALLEVEPGLQLVLLYQARLNPEVGELLASLRRPHPSRVEVRLGGLRSTGLPSRGGAWMPWQPPIRRLAGEVDVYHAGEGALPRPDGTAVVATVHDLTTELFPEYHTRLNRVYDRRRRRWLERHADFVATDSESTQRDLVRLHPALAGRARVVLLAHGADSAADSAADAAPEAHTFERLRRTHGLGDSPLVLSVGTLEPRKNQETLVQAFASVATAHPSARLVLAGRHGWKHEALLRALADSPVRDRIHLLGGVSPRELAALYAGATIFAYPSFYEGFGLPVLEAMAAGLPVVTSIASSLPEVAGDAAILVDPARADDLASAISRLLGDDALRARMSAAGRRRAGTFTWERTARETLALYHLALEAARDRRSRRRDQGRTATKV